MTEPVSKAGAIRRFFAARPWIGYGAAYLIILAYALAGARNLYTAFVHGYVHGRDHVNTYDSDPTDFIVKVAISVVTTLVLGTVTTFATVGWLHVWRRKRRARRAQARPPLDP